MEHPIIQNERSTEHYADDLYRRLAEYGRGPSCPFHMPGHKRRFHLIQDPYAIDITEIDGFDNLHHAGGILLRAQERAANLYGSAAAFYLINGSTAGLLTAICAVCSRGDSILAARNCHKSVYHAVWMRGLSAVWMYPEMDARTGVCGSILPETVERELQKNPGIRAVVLTSPTYDGICSDVRALAKIAHRHNAVLIVDEAHGAHFGMHPYLPQSAVTLGADAVIQSMHKTLPALTQTALLHICSPRIRLERVRKFLEVFQTSSPSYVLMASMDRCICMLQQEGPALYGAYAAQLQKARTRLEGLKCLHLVNGKEISGYCHAYDPSRIVIAGKHPVPGRSFGRYLSGMMRSRWSIEAEMEAEQYVVFLTSVGDTADSFGRLCEALEAVDREMADRGMRDLRLTDHETSGCEPADRETSEREMSDREPADCGTSDRELADCGTSDREPGNGGTSDHTAGRLTASRMRFPVNETVLRMDEAEEAPQEEVPLFTAQGRISADTIYLYPPGIPLLIPGERIGGELLERLARYNKEGFSLQGMADPEGRQIRVLKDRNGTVVYK